MTIGELKNQGFDVNDEILKIWKKYSKITEGSIFPLQYWDGMELDGKCIFVGFNPSFRFTKVDSELKEILNEGILDKSLLEKIGYEPNHGLRSEARKSYLAGVFKYSKENSESHISKQAEVIKTLVKRARQKLDYYDRHNQFCKALFEDEKCWEHIDLFQWHHSSQNTLEDLLCTDERHLEFGRDQATLTMQILERCAQLRAVIFANSSTWNAFKKCKLMKSNWIPFDEAARSISAEVVDRQDHGRVGSAFITFASGEQVPICFSGQLAQFRGISIETFETLVSVTRRRINSKAYRS